MAGCSWRGSKVISTDGLCGSCHPFPDGPALKRVDRMWLVLVTDSKYHLSVGGELLSAACWDFVKVAGMMCYRCSML